MKLKPSNDVPKRGSYTSKCIYHGRTIVCSIKTDRNPQGNIRKGIMSAFLPEKLV